MVRKGDKGQKSINRIALFATGWSNEYVKLVIEGLRVEAAKDGVDIFMFISNSLIGDAPQSVKVQRSIYQMVRAEDYDGVIILANTYADNDEIELIANKFRGTGVPMVSTEVAVPGAAFIGTNNTQGMRELATHLVEEHGVKKVVYVAGYEGNVECEERRRTLEEVLEEHGLKLSGSIRGNYEYYWTMRKIQEWVDDGNEIPDAFVCANDLMALGIVSGLHKKGYETPRDVIVTGFDHIHEAQISYPMISTVSRQWDIIGALAYKELINLIENKPEDSSKVYSSHFVPSESCGCDPKKEDVQVRLNKMRNSYENYSNELMIEFFFQAVRVDMSKVESKEEFERTFQNALKNQHFFGEDYCICLDPTFFDLEEEEYVSSVNGFKDVMRVVYERKEGKGTGCEEVSLRELYPGYKKEEGKSNIYVMTPLHYTRFLLGYVAIKNTPEILYDQKFIRWLNNFANLFITVKQYIFSQRNNRKLQELYMTDSLSGLYNRLGCDRVLFPFIEKEKAEGRKSILLFIDINNMKIINDEYGHLNGDLAIKAIAETLSNSLGEKWYIGRYGGDEFVAVGQYREDGGDMLKYREYFKSALDEIIKGLKITFQLSASIGEYIIEPDDKGSIEDYIRLADESMYEEKERAHRQARLRRHSED
ncbi:diguanylate cyclase [Eubacterium xylanophilum]|uniref:diguanylate cyclase n=1 Tax=Eubacterium xylanophilum TaxID=39497 RepID=UPI00047B5206|nr:diguanylate cyclase [Eubacterium xylanophilum]